jgi:hypothetical protein
MNPKYGVGIGFLITLSLVVFFGCMQENGSRFLDLPIQWIILSLLPVIISLFIYGYITKFESFGILLESAVKAPLSTSIELKAIQAPVYLLNTNKDDLTALNRMSVGEKLSIKSLIFELGKKNYTDHGILEYLKKLKNLDFLEVRTQNGGFHCFIPANFFKENSDSKLNTTFNDEKIARFIEAIKEGNVIQRFNNIAISLTVKSSESLINVLKAMREENVEIAAMVSDSGKYKGGVIFSRDVEKKIADAVLSSQKDE